MAEMLISQSAGACAWAGAPLVANNNNNLLIKL